MIGADDPPLPAPLLLDLLAAVLDGGSPPAAALRAIAAGLEDAGDARARALQLMSGRLDNPMSASPGRNSTEGRNSIAERYPAGGRYAAEGRYSAGTDHLIEPSADRLLAEVEEELLLAARSGLAPTTLIRRAAADSRRKQAAAQLKAIRRLEVMIVVPAGVCLLPAFVLLGVVPLMIGLLRG